MYPTKPPDPQLTYQAQKIEQQAVRERVERRANGFSTASQRLRNWVAICLTLALLVLVLLWMLHSFARLF